MAFLSPDVQALLTPTGYIREAQKLLAQPGSTMTRKDVYLEMERHMQLLTGQRKYEDFATFDNAMTRAGLREKQERRSRAQTNG